MQHAANFEVDAEIFIRLSIFKRFHPLWLERFKQKLTHLNKYLSVLKPLKLLIKIST